MEEEVAAYIHKRAPGDKHSEWNQRGLKRALAELKQSDPAVYDVLLKEGGAEVAVGYRISPEEIGQYGYDSGYHYEPDLNPEALEDVDDSPGLCKSVYDVWISGMRGVIEEDIGATLFTPKEMAVFLASRHPRENEKTVADALDVSVGTVRGKLGRVKGKLAEAQSTQHWDEIAGGEGLEEWDGDGHSAPYEVIDYVDEGRLPVNAGSEVVVGDGLN